MRKWFYGLAITVMIPVVFSTDIAFARGNVGNGWRPEEILAVTVRQQGMTCDRPISAIRDRHVSTKPGKVAWVLTCDNGRFLVKFVRDTAAQVIPLNRGALTSALKLE